MALRTSLRLFLTANDAYSNATITAYKVDAAGTRLGTLATLYDAPTGGSPIANPFNLDSDGKLPAPVYFTEPMICSIYGVEVPAHDTGVIGIDAFWRGDYLSGQTYYAGNVVRDGATKSVYVAAVDFTASGLSTDVAAGRLDLMVDVSAVSTETITRHTATGDGTTTAFTMPVTPANTASVIVSVAGADSTAWTLSTNTVTFNSAPANGAALVFHIITTAGSELSGGGGGTGYGTIWCGTATGTKNARIISPSPAVTSLVAGMRLSFVNGNEANDDVATLQVSALPSVPWVRATGAVLSPADAPANGLISVVFDGTSLRLDTESFEAAAVPDATETVKGVSEISTQNETDAGVDDERQVTPKKLRNMRRARNVASAIQTIIDTDNGAIIRFSGSFTQPLPPAATMTNGFSILVVNVGTGLITFDPNGSEQIAGGLTFLLPPLFSAELFCTGTEWLVLRCPSEILIKTQTVTGSAVGSVDFPLVSPELDYRLTFRAKASAASIMLGRTSTDGGANFDNGANNYIRSYMLDAGSGGTPVAGREGATDIYLSPTLENSSAWADGTLTLFPGSSGMGATIPDISSCTITTGGTFVTFRGSGQRAASAAVNAFRFLFSAAANISVGSVFSLYGVRR